MAMTQDSTAGTFSLDTMLATVPKRKGGPMVPDEQDGQRGVIPRRLWQSQDSAYRQRDRQIEENIRMLAGQQWSVYNHLLGRWIDVTQFMTDEERRWRQRPVFNRVLPWYMLTHARATENPPIVTFLPGPDRIDADLAETLDIICKVVWREADCTDAWDRLAGWFLVAGTAFLQSRIDMDTGPVNEWRGPAEIPVVAMDETGQKVNTGQTMMAENVPFDERGEPLAVWIGGQMEELGPPYRARDPKIVTDVLSPLEVRGEWGPTPWHMKRWHLSRHFLTTGQVKARFGAEVPADASLSGGMTGMGDSGETARILFGGGYYGPNATGALAGDTTQAMATEGMVDVYCLWVRPVDANDLGRYLVTTASGKVLYDGDRPINYPNTSPIRRWDFVRLPGRQNGTTPQDSINHPQRMYNKRWAQLFEHAALVANPKPVIDANSGLRANQWTNEPGVAVVVNKRANVTPIEWISPPNISGDVWRLLGELRNEITDLGNLKGTDGESPTMDASGELVKELRFNSDRFLGPTLRRAPDEWARVFEDWRAMLPKVYPFEKMIAYAGEDNAARTILVRPDLFTQGKVNCVADTESMLPEGRGERMQRIYAMWKDGAFGPPLTPPALKMFYEMMRFPHMSRASKPGGVDRITADQENARLLMGEPAEAVGFDQITGVPFEWYDNMIHLESHETFMKSPEFLKQPPPVQMEFAKHRMMHLSALMQSMPAQAPLSPAGPPQNGPPAPPQ